MYKVGQVVLARSIAPPIYVLSTMLARVVAIRTVPVDDCVAFQYHLFYPLLGVFSEGYEAETTLSSVERKTLTTAERSLQAMLEELADMAYDLETEEEDEKGGVESIGYGEEFEDDDEPPPVRRGRVPSTLADIGFSGGIDEEADDV